MDSQQCGIQEDSTCRADSICSCTVGDEGDDGDTANIVISSINVDNIETEVNSPSILSPLPQISSYTSELALIAT